MSIFRKISGLLAIFGVVAGLSSTAYAQGYDTWSDDPFLHNRAPHSLGLQAGPLSASRAVVGISLKVPFGTHGQRRAPAYEPQLSFGVDLHNQWTSSSASYGVSRVAFGYTLSGKSFIRSGNELIMLDDMDKRFDLSGNQTIVVALVGIAAVVVVSAVIVGDNVTDDLQGDFGSN